MENSKKRTISILAFVVMAIAILVGIFAMPTQNAVAEEGIQPFGDDTSGNVLVGGQKIYLRLNAIDSSEHDYFYIRVNVAGYGTDKILAKYCFVLRFLAKNGEVQYAYFTSQTEEVIFCPEKEAADLYQKTHENYYGRNDNSSYARPVKGQLSEVGVWGWIWCKNSYYETYRNFNDDGTAKFTEFKYN